MMQHCIRPLEFIHATSRIALLKIIQASDKRIGLHATGISVETQ